MEELVEELLYDRRGEKGGGGGWKPENEHSGRMRLVLLLCTQLSRERAPGLAEIERLPRINMTCGCAARESGSARLPRPRHSKPPRTGCCGNHGAQGDVCGLGGACACAVAGKHGSGRLQAVASAPIANRKSVGGFPSIRALGAAAGRWARKSRSNEDLSASVGWLRSHIRRLARCSL